MLFVEYLQGQSRDVCTSHAVVLPERPGKGALEYGQGLNKKSHKAVFLKLTKITHPSTKIRSIKLILEKCLIKRS